MPDNEQPQSSIILYQTEDGRTRIQCRFENETIWLTQALIAELFHKDVRTINEHLLNIYDDGELPREATIRNFRIVRFEGNREVARDIEHYSLPVIIAVGYRVRSPRGTQFRQWATDSGEALAVRDVARKIKEDQTDQQQWALYAIWLESEDAPVRANATICLINQVNFLLDQQIAALEKQFMTEGGYSEQLAAARLAERSRNKKRSDRSDRSDRPNSRLPGVWQGHGATDSKKGNQCRTVVLGLFELPGL